MLGKDRLKLQSHISNHNLHSSAHARGISNSSFKHTLCANETWDAAAAAQNSSGVLPVSQAGAQVWGRQSVSPLQVGITGGTHHCRCHGCGLCCDGSALLGVLEALCAAGRAGERPVVKAHHLDVGAVEGWGQKEEASQNKALFSSFLLTLLAQLTTGLLLPFQSVPLKPTAEITQQ